MADAHPTPHPDLAGFVLGALEPGEAAAFEAHLAGCATCRAEVDDLAPMRSLLESAVPAVDLPADLRQRTLAAAAAAGRGDVASPAPTPGDARPASSGDAGIRALRGARPGPRTSAGRWRRPLAVVGAVAAGILLVASVAVRFDGGGGAGTTTQLALGQSSGTVEVERTPSGWRIDLDLDLPRRADGRYYEALLQGPGGRVSVGTFNEGHDVVLWSGVAPSVFDQFVIVEQPGDVEVVRARLRL